MLKEQSEIVEEKEQGIKEILSRFSVEESRVLDALASGLYENDSVRQNIQELFDYKRRLSIAVREAKICVYEVDVERQLYTFFENSEAIFGVSGEKILQDVRPYSKLPPEEYKKAVSDYFAHPDDANTISDAFATVFNGESTSYEARMRAGNSKYVWCRVEIATVKDNAGSTRIIGIISDIQHSREQIDTLSQEVLLDSFTRLYSKKHFEELSRSILAERPHEKMALIMLDLDDFKAVNDTCGHQVGDRVLLSVARHLREKFRRQDIIARFGGDEFVILMREVPSVDMVINRVKMFLQDNDNELGITKSVGITFYPDASTDYDELLDKADAALYIAKKAKNTYAVL